MLAVDCRKRLGALDLAVGLEAKAGRPLVLVGPNGAGKTSILNLLAGLLLPDEGTIELDGVCWFDGRKGIAWPAHRRPVGYVLQDFALFPHLSALENVAFGPRAAGAGRAEARARARAALDRYGIGHLAGRRPGALSGGEKQRLALARAIVLEPRLLLLDEPLSALDPEARRDLRGELRRILDEAPCVTVLVTHDPLEAIVFGARIAVVDGGRIVQTGPREELLERPRSRIVAELMGLNFVRGRIVSREADGLVEVAADGARLRIVHDGSDEGELLISIDPREITLHPAPPVGTAQNVLRGPIVQLVPEPPFGERVRVMLGTTPPLVAEVTAHAARTLGLVEGMIVYASFKAFAPRSYR